MALRKRLEICFWFLYWIFFVSFAICICIQEKTFSYRFVCRRDNFNGWRSLSQVLLSLCFRLESIIRSGFLNV